MKVMEEYYSSILDVFLIQVFDKLSDNRTKYKMKVTKKTDGKDQTPEIVSPFPTELQGLITNAITIAAPIAAKIPGFRSEKAGSTTFDQHFNALPPENLARLKQCIASIDFKTHDLRVFKGNLIRDIEKYESKEKANRILGTSRKK